jgi:hypothetical protein
MPKSLQDILDHADELADRFERGDFEPDWHDARGTRMISEGIERRARAERDIADGVAQARADGIDWGSIGMYLGTTGEAARQRYGPAIARATAESASAPAESPPAKAKRSTSRRTAPKAKSAKGAKPRATKAAK